MPEIRQFSVASAFSRKRHCDTGWLILQTKCLVDEAVKSRNASALVYSALEARNSIEQLGFDIVMICHLGSMPKKAYVECRKKGGVFEVLQKVQPEYRKLVQFTALCLADDLKAPKVVEWDIRRLRRLWNSLSAYCHAQLHPAETLDDTGWFSGGCKLVQETCDYIIGNLTQAATGLAHPESLSTYAKQIWDEFKMDKISKEQAAMRLRLVQPLSKAELRGKKLIIVPRAS